MIIKPIVLIVIKNESIIPTSGKSTIGSTAKVAQSAMIARLGKNLMTAKINAFLYN